MQVVNLGSCREMLKVWAEVRSQIISGDLSGVIVSTKNRQGDDKVLFAGEFQRDKAEAAKAVMRISWELAKADKTKIKSGT